MQPPPTDGPRSTPHGQAGSTSHAPRPLCPRDGTPLALQRVGEVDLDYCPSCFGLFFDGGEIEQLEGRSPLLFMSRRPPTELTPLCVRCDTKMTPYRYSGKAGGPWGYGIAVEIDHCSKCGSFWLDGGELQSVQRMLATEKEGHIRVDDVTAGQYVLMLLTGVPLEYNVKTTKRPWMTITLLALNVALYLLSIAASVFGFGGEDFARTLGVTPVALSPFTFYTLLTYQFAHAGIIHLAGNMYFLYVFGDNLEERWGKAVYVAAYLGIGVVAGLAHALLTGAPTMPLVGASGAISGLLGAYLATFPKARLGCVFFFIPLRVSVLVYMGLYVLLQVVFTLIEKLADQPFGVSFSCHAGGFIAGLLVGLALRRMGASARTGG